MKGGSPMWELLYETFWDRLDVYKRQELDRAIRISSVCRRGFLLPR